MQTFSYTKRSQQRPSTVSITDNEEMKNYEPMHQDNVSVRHSFSSETNSNNANRYVNTLAIVENQHQCASPPTLPNQAQCLSRTSSSVKGYDSIKEASSGNNRQEISFVSRNVEIRHGKDDRILINQPMVDMDAIEIMDTLSPPIQDNESQTDATYTVDTEQQHEPFWMTIRNNLKL
jgi:hypothetical protein